MQPQMPLGPPMGGMMGPPMGQPVQVPMGSIPGSQQVQGNRGIVGYGGDARGRAGFREYMRRRKSESQVGMVYPQGSMGLMPALAPPPVPQLGMPRNAMIGRQVSVGGISGSAPVQMGSGFGGGVVPLFGGLGRY